MSEPDANDGARPGPLLAGPAPRPPASKRRRSRARRIVYAMLAPVLILVARCLWATVRVGRVEGEEHLDVVLAKGDPVVVCFWHDELVANTMFLTRRFARAGRPLAFMVSPSVDGDLVTRVLEGVGGVVARGSATRSGVKVLRDLYRLMRKQGASPLILPDGPQGPPHELKSGVVLLSHLADAPILCVASASRRPWRLGTWDRLQVPRPFARLALVVAEPRAPAHHDGDAELEMRRTELEAFLRALGERARAAL